MVLKDGLLLIFFFSAALVLLFVSRFFNMKRNRIMRLGDTVLTCDELEAHARKIAILHTISRKQNRSNWPVRRMNENYQLILSVYKEFNEDVRRKRGIPQSAEWLLDNFYIIEEQVKSIRRDLDKETIRKLPVLRCGMEKGTIRILAVANELVSHADGQMDDQIILRFLNAYQSNGYLYQRELWSLPVMIRLALLENIRQLCEGIRILRREWRQADELMDTWLGQEDQEAENLMKLFNLRMKNEDALHPAFVEHLIFRLRRSGRSYVHILRSMDESLGRFGTSHEEITAKEHHSQAVSAVSMGNNIMSLKYISSLDWVELFESVSIVEEWLKKDPAGVYSRMDFTTRDDYRKKVEQLAFRHGFSEIHGAREAIALAESTGTHVGYYLLGKGYLQLEERLGIKRDPLQRGIAFFLRKPGILYFLSIGIIFILLESCILRYAGRGGRGKEILLFLAGLLAIVPCSEIAINFVNWCACKIKKPVPFPRMELKEGIPEELHTFVVIPAVLSDEKRIRELLENLERHYLSNHEDNLSFAIIGDFKDAEEAVLPGEEALVAFARNGIRQLNEKYSSLSLARFYFFYRHRQWNPSHNRWMGWERKRGALSEFNDLLLGIRGTAFEKTLSDDLKLPETKYVITLDADTILPMGMAKKLIGAMSHPLNIPVAAPGRGIVMEGYGLMQPRIHFDLASANRTWFSQIFTGQEGLDPYACAISDIYQDFFGEGIFTGKGIYDLRVFQQILKNVIPENTILSHDLLEGSYVRAGLVTDLELVDGYPSSFSTYTTRLHRWVRGDWQLLPWLCPRVKNRQGTKIRNPLSMISRWKIFDNLRRSLLHPALMLVMLLGFTVLPGSGLFWFGFTLATLGANLIIETISSLLSGKLFRSHLRQYHWTISGLRANLFQTLLQLVFLPYQALLLLNAILVTLNRVWFTRKNMLEWVTAADAERIQKNTLSEYRTKMLGALVIAFAFIVPAMLLKPADLPWSAASALIWGASPWIAYGISRVRVKKNKALTEENLKELRIIARKTWRYFEDFADAKNHYLAPDNYQEEPPRGVAHRTSPTNIGLGLLAILTARDFGYIGTLEMVESIDNTVTTMEKLEKWNGHLYNWYDTKSLQPLRPGYISTVDSGNLACYLVTLIQGLEEYRTAPLINEALLHGVNDMMDMLEDEEVQVYRTLGLYLMEKEKKSLDIGTWYRVLNECNEDNKVIHMKKTPWKSKLGKMIKMHKRELERMMPWLSCFENIPEALLQNASEKVGALMAEVRDTLHRHHPLNQMPEQLKNVLSLAALLEKEIDDSSLIWLHELQLKVQIALEHAEKLLNQMEALIGRVRELLDHMHFAPLYVEKKQLFSIGYNIEENRLTNSFYDLLASEARQTSYIAIARGEVPQKHWFKMGRALTAMDGYKGLVSWTGTMFEYLMPLILMKNYKNTLMDETYAFVIRSQRKYGRQRGIPWGVSESGFYSLDVHLDYQYKAIGVPWLGLKRGLAEDAVVAPYATFLALLVDQESAMENIKILKKAGMEGPYGFYEAIDYTLDRIPFGTKSAIVKSFMAHHQGMSLLSLNNFIHGNVLQKRFHADPVVSVAQLLLQEKVPSNFLFTKETKEKVAPWKSLIYKDKGDLRRVTRPDPLLPKAHILSNGAYSVMLTDRGTGYSKHRKTMISRWREDSTLDDYGMFFYFRDLDSGRMWSSGSAPLHSDPESYEVTFTSEKVRYRRKDGDIETETEIIVTAEDPGEIRRITIKNRGKRVSQVEITSYFEVVLADQGADVAHPAFSNLFVKTEYNVHKKCLTAHRRSRSEAEKAVHLGHMLITDGNPVSDIQFETDRMQFIGRGQDVSRPAKIERNKPLSDSVGPVLDPVMSLRARVSIEPGKSSVLSFLTVFSESNDRLVKLLEKYDQPAAVEGAFKLAVTRSRVELGFLNRKASEIELYQDLISHILFMSPTRRGYSEVLSKNRKGQSSLWAYGISGDLPILLVVLSRAEETDILYEVLKAHEYWRIKNFTMDMVVLSEEENSYVNPLKDLLSDVVSFTQFQEQLNKPGGIFILDRNNISEEDVNLMYAAARVVFRGNGGTMGDQLRKRPAVKTLRKKEFSSLSYKEARLSFKTHSLVHFNGLGGMNPDNSEYVIVLEKGQNTPAPWSNVISNPHFGFLVTESGGGFTWSENSRENKLTVWSNDPVSDSPGEVIYFSDSTTGEVWTVTPLPVREDTPYVIRHGFGYTAFEHASHGLEHHLLQFVPMEDPVKISLIHVKNGSDVVRNVHVTYYIRPVLGVTDQVTAMHIQSTVSPEGMLMLQNNYNEEFPGRICFMDASEGSISYTGDRKEFFGSGSLGHPHALHQERLSGNTGTGYDPCGAIQVQLRLEPKEGKDLVLLLGMGRSPEEAKKLASKYKSVISAQKALEEVGDFWREKLGAVQIKTPQSAMDLLMNGWLLYQVISCRLWARSGFYQSGGAFGFRDQLQDILPLIHFWPQAARNQILLHAAHQFAEGDVQHWWHEPWGKGTRTRFSDDLLWLPYVTAEYIRITGDTKILEEKVVFLKDEILKPDEDERYSSPGKTDFDGSIYEHCVLAIEKALKFGTHGLPLMGSGDWNDGMSTVGNKGKGESVWLGWFLYTVLDLFSPLMKAKGDAERKKRYTQISKELVQALEENAWDGSWYRRAYFDSGIPLGSARNSECQIDSLAQTWAVISGSGDPVRIRQAMESMENYLVLRDEGLVKLLTPAFDEGDLEPGYIKGYVPGVRENGGQYTHAAAWVIIALAKMGEGDKAWEIFELINPINHTRTPIEYGRYKVEPYVMAADVYAVPPHVGRGGWTWYTGSAGWIYKAGLEYLLGFQKSGTKLVMDPCVPRKCPELTIHYQYLDTPYEIKVVNPEGANKGVKKISLDGKSIRGNSFELQNDREAHRVEVRLGK